MQDKTHLFKCLYWIRACMFISQALSKLLCCSHFFESLHYIMTQFISLYHYQKWFVFLIKLCWFFILIELIHILLKRPYHSIRAFVKLPILQLGLVLKGQPQQTWAYLRTAECHWQAHHEQISFFRHRQCMANNNC
jgi:hypothetical protein